MRTNNEIETYIHDQQARWADNKVLYRGRITPMRSSDTLILIAHRRRSETRSLEAAVWCLFAMALVVWAVLQ